MILFGSMSLASGLLALIFPETHNTKLPDNIEEAENIGKAAKKGGGDAPAANGGSGGLRDVVVDDLKGGLAGATPVKKTSVSARPTRTSVSARNKKTSVCSLGSVQVTVPEKSSSPTPASSPTSPDAEKPSVEPETVTVHL